MKIPSTFLFYIKDAGRKRAGSLKRFNAVWK